MPKGYHHLTVELRCQIFALKESGLPNAQIARQLGMHHTTVGRELKRNRGGRGYRYKQADSFAKNRRKKASSEPRKMTPQTISFLECRIREHKDSPEQAASVLKKERGISVSHERIYQHIWRDKKAKGTLYKSLRRSGKKYNKRSGKTAGRGLIPDRVSIEERPPEVELKTRVGDWEGDTIVGSKHRGAIISLVERKTKLVRLRLISATKAKETSAAMIASLSSIDQHVHTITLDNGKEFALHKNVSSALNARIFFAHPYASWERGLNENTNGLVRQFFPKGTDFTTLTHEQVEMVEKNLNNRPRKTLNYRTPNEEFLRLTSNHRNCALRD